MHTQETVNQQIKSAGIDTFLLPKRELKVLPEVLIDDETIIHLVQGMYKNSIGILCLTSKRILFIDKGLLFGLKIEEFPIKTVSSISYESGIMMAKIKVFASGNNAEITHVENGAAQTFSSKTRQSIDQLSEQLGKTKDASNTTDTIDRLERLASLKEKGIISEEEFKSEKEKILSKQE